MKKGVFIVLSVLLCFGFAACTGQQTAPPTSGQNSRQEQSDIQNGTNRSENQSANSQATDSLSKNSETPETEGQKVKLTINGREFDGTLYDTPAANALYDMLPLELNFKDFNGIEKIAFMEKDFPTEGEPDEFDPDVGDLCLYVPWGNLSIFYKDFRSSNGLISLGHLNSDMDLIAAMDHDFSAVLDRAE